MGIIYFLINCNLTWHIVVVTYVFLNGPSPASFSFIFGLFKQTTLFLHQIYVKKCHVHPIIWPQDSNPCESLPITIRPGLLPKVIMFVFLSVMKTRLKKCFIPFHFITLNYFYLQHVHKQTTNFASLFFHIFSVFTE